jgi:acyl-CoA thioesterase FadM
MTHGYTLVEDVSVVGTPGQHHLLDHQTQALVTTLWTSYLATVRGALTPNGVHPVLRRVSYSLEGEAFPGDALRCGLRAASRSRRSCTLEGAVWHAADERMVHVAQLVTVFVDPTRPGAVEVPEDFWREVERLEGRPIPVTSPAPT